MTNSLLRNQREIIRELLSSQNNYGIIIGRDQNIDSVAAGLGFYLVLKAYGKDVQVISRKDPSVEVSNLFGAGDIKRAFDGLTKILTISVPYREGEIEKVSYNIEQDRLNVNLFAENTGINFTEGDIEYIRKGSSPSVIITIGVSDESEFSDFVDPKSVKTIHIDRNPINPLIGDVSMIDPSFSSLSEIVASLVMELGLPADPDAFQNLMDGITYATRNFTLQTTSPFAFETAGFLLQNGAKRKEKAQRLSPRNDTARSFPQEDYFLNQQKSQEPRLPRAQGVTQLQNQDQASDDISNVTKASGEAEAEPSDIPDDWFLPKVFKGSKKGN
jgi:nanoRNase/pAp phosphatase (c-di-AMP/oligoRNAs hydrolase)